MNYVDYVGFYIYIYIQLLQNFLEEFNRFEFRVFLFLDKHTKCIFVNTGKREKLMNKFALK